MTTDGSLCVRVSIDFPSKTSGQNFVPRSVWPVA